MTKLIGRREDLRSQMISVFEKNAKICNLIKKQTQFDLTSKKIHTAVVKDETVKEFEGKM